MKKKKLRVKRAIVAYVIALLGITQAPAIYKLVGEPMPQFEDTLEPMFKESANEEVESTTSPNTVTADRVEIYSPVLGRMVSPKEQLDLQLLIYTEAGDQSEECQVAVGTTVINRVISCEYPNSIQEVIFQEGQFTPAVPVSNNYGYFTMNGETFTYQDIPEYCRETIFASMLEALEGNDPTGISPIYFCNPSLLGWDEIERRNQVTEYIQLGDVIFYREWPEPYIEREYSSEECYDTDEVDEIGESVSMDAYYDCDYDYDYDSDSDYNND